MCEEVIDYINNNIIALTDAEEETIKGIIENEYRPMSPQERIDYLAKYQDELNKNRMKIIKRMSDVKIIKKGKNE